MTIENLIRVLNSVPAGAIPTSISDELFKYVVASWNEFSGSRITNMNERKILRDEGPDEVTWYPPYLTFVIDRHGGTVLGSTRAERQQWKLNLEKRTADQMPIGYRQLRPNASKLDVKPLADGVCTAVGEGPSSPSRLEIVRGGGYQRTVSGRRKRLIADLKTKMELIGWKLFSRGRGLTFKRTKWRNCRKREL